MGILSKEVRNDHRKKNVPICFSPSKKKASFYHGLIV
jgi:hypothetical protein